MLSFVRRVGKTCRANMVNKTFLPPAKHPAKRLSPLKIGISGLGTAFADVSSDRTAWESLGGLRDRQIAAWEGNVFADRG
jgi:hypothetical protein